MKRLPAVLLLVLALPLVGLGLLFLVGSAGQASRLAVAAIALGLGGVSAGFGMRWLRQLRRLAPGYIRAEILELARRRNGELSEADLKAKLGRRWPHAREPLAALGAEGLSRERVEERTRFWVFPDLQPRLAVMRCEFCSSELPLDKDLSSCPNCGGSVSARVKRMALSEDDHYSMDD